MKKILPYLLVALFVAINIFWRLAATPWFKSLPVDFSYSATVASNDNFWDDQLQLYTGEQESLTRFILHAKSIDSGVLDIENTFTVTSSAGDVIFSASRMYGIDQISKKHVPGHGDKDREGYLFAPAGLKPGDSFDYWHINYDAPAKMVFVGEEYLHGLKVYIYESTYDGYVIDQTENLSYLPGVPEERRIILDPNLTLWVEPTTGWLVKYRDDTIAYYYDKKTGTQLFPWNHFKNEFTEESMLRQVEAAKYLKVRYQLVDYGFPITSLILMLLIFLVIPSKRRVPFQNVWTTIMIIALSAIVTYLSWWTLDQQKQSIIQDHLEEEVTDIEKTLTERLEVYTNALVSSEGIFDIFGSVDKKDWKIYVESVNIPEHYPGLQGMGFAQFVKPEDKDTFEKMMIDEFGWEDFEIYPEGDRELYSAVTLLEPLDIPNQQAISYDMFSEPIRREAMVRARDTGFPAMTGRVTLVQEIDDDDVQAGFLIYVPYYDAEADPVSVKDRRDNIIGYVYSPFRMNDFIYKVIQGDHPSIDFQIYDGDNVMDNSLLMYDRGLFNDVADPGLVSKKDILYIYGHPWTVVYFMDPEKTLSPLELGLPTLVLIAGIGFSILLVIIFLSLLTKQVHSEHVVEELGDVLSAEKMKADVVLDGIADGVMVLDEKLVITRINKSISSMFNIDVNSLEEKPFFEIVRIVDEHNRIVKQSELFTKDIFEGIPFVRSDLTLSISGSEQMPVSISASPIIVNDKFLAIAVVLRDRTEEKSHEMSLKKHMEEVERLNRLMVGRELKMRELKKQLRVKKP